MTPGGAPPSPRRGLDWKAVLGLALSAGLLWFAFRDVHLAEVWDRMRRADLPLLALSGLLATILFPLRALRWRPLLEPSVGATRFRNRFAATNIGFMANNLLPARVGEFARAFALTRLEPVGISASLGSLVVERMFDGIVLVLFLLVALAWPSFPDVTGRDFSGPAGVVAVVLLILFLLLLAVVVRPERSVTLFERTLARLLPSSFRRPVVDALAAFLEGLGAIRSWRLMLEAFGWSLIIWLAGSLAFWVGFLAFDIHLPFIAAIFLQSLVSLAVALPSAPGFFGVFEAAARVGLVDVWAVAAGPAVAFAIGFHMAGFIPVTVLGLYEAWRMGLSWAEVGGSEEVVETAVEAGTRAAPDHARGPTISAGNGGPLPQAAADDGESDEGGGP